MYESEMEMKKKKEIMKIICENGISVIFSAKAKTAPFLI
jgi:hypothetical protein